MSNSFSFSQAAYPAEEINVDLEYGPLKSGISLKNSFPTASNLAGFSMQKGDLLFWK